MLENPSLNICLETLQEKLVEYLKTKNIQINSSGKFKCLNPAHDDSTPSCSIIPNSSVFHCFGCGTSGTIFHAANMLEGLPQSGPGFFNVTIKQLCERFGVLPPELEMTPEQQALAEIYSAYQEANTLIRCSHNKYNDVKYQELFKNREWNPTVGERFSVGIVESFNKFISDLRNRGVTDQTIKRAGLYRPDMFNGDTFIFGILDERGTPVGFSARDMKHDTDPQMHQSKYINTAQECPIYKKREILYGLNLAKNIAKEKGLIVVEGYGDVITMHEKGIHNVVAIGGTAMTPEHVQLILKYGINKIFLCLDNDNGGQLAVKQILDNVIAAQPLQADIIQLPEGQDPDDFLKPIPLANAKAQWETLPKISCFQWRIQHFDTNISPEEIAEKMIPLITTEPNIIRREKMIKELAENTQVRLTAIQGEIDRISRVEEFKNSERLRSIATQAIKELRRNPAGAKEIFSSYQTMIEQFQASSQIDNVGISETLEAFDTITHGWLNRTNQIAGIPTGWKEMDEAINGMQEGRAIGIGGKPNHGKTSFVSTIALNVAKKMDNDTIVLIHSTDDNREVVFSKLAAIDQELEMNFVTNPVSYIRNKTNAEIKALEEKWEIGRKNIRDLIKVGKLVIKDATHGTTLGYTETMIKYYKDAFPKSRILTIFDNFHKAQDFAEWDERIRFKKMSHVVKTLAEKYWVAMLATMEYTKLPEGQRPENTDLSESVQMEYDLSVIMHVYNELRDLGPDKAKLVTIKQQGTPQEDKDPIVSIKVGKNKQAVFASNLYFYFKPAIGKFQECPSTFVASLLRPNPAGLKGTSQFGKLGQY